MTEPPMAFHSVRVLGQEFGYHIDDDARREIELWLQHAPNPALDVVTIYGEEVTLVRGMVVSIHSTTPESRRLDREHARAIQEEVPIEERG